MVDEASTCTSRRGGGVLISMPKKMEGAHERKKERERERDGLEREFFMVSNDSSMMASPLLI